MNSHQQKGIRVSKHSRSARTPSLRTGFLATLRGVLGGFGGSGASLDVGGRLRATKHQSNGGGQQLVTSTRLNATAHRHVLSRRNSAAIPTPCVLALLGPALVAPALGGPEAPPTVLTAKAMGMGESK
jgi:hypothetical protein